MAARTFEDSTGKTWEVFEVHRASKNPGAVSAGLELGWLAFVNGQTKRRLAPFPSGWEQASATELERLCASARQAKPPRFPGRTSGPHPSIRSSGERRSVAEAEVASAGQSTRISEPSDVPPLRLSGDTHSVEDAVRTFAHQARLLSLPAIEAMVRLKSLLLESFPAADSEARDMRRVRRWFVETYYFDRDV